MADDVSPEDKKRRLAALETIQAAIVTEINAQLKGKIVEILVEGKQKGKWFGRTGTDKLYSSRIVQTTGEKLVHLMVGKTVPGLYRA